MSFGIERQAGGNLLGGFFSAASGAFFVAGGFFSPGRFLFRRRAFFFRAFSRAGAGGFGADSFFGSGLFFAGRLREQERAGALGSFVGHGIRGGD
jgi:hypothetical protein